MTNAHDAIIHVAGWISISLVDVLENPSFTVWFNYCNFRCPWCQNAHVVDAVETKRIRVKDLIEEIKRASTLVEYVQATGGEPTIQADGLRALFELCKDEAHIKTSLSTNGSRSDVIRGLLESGLLDHAAVDVKAPLGNPSKYGEVIGLGEQRAVEIVEEVRSSVSLLVESVPFIEFRTTMVPTLLSKDDVVEVAVELREYIRNHGNAAYVIQQFLPSGTLIDPKFADVERTPIELLMETAKEVKDEAGLRRVYVRTQELGVVKI